MDFLVGAGAVLLIVVAFAVGLFAGRRSRAAQVDPPPAATAAARRTETEEPEPGAATRFDAVPASELPTFANVGGLDDVKRELTDTLDLLVRHPDDAAAYHVTWNGILLHGPPGTGKTLLARAAAGEFGLTLVPISASDLLAATRAEGAHNVDDAFAFALAHRPALLLFDDFDAIAAQNDGSDLKHRAIIGALVDGLERTRDARDLIVMATTNNLGDLDRMVIRPGRFDRQIRIDLPDAAARRAIFASCLEGLPLAPDVDTAALASRTEGASPAAIARTVRAAALEALSRARRSGQTVSITQEILAASLASGGADRPTIEDHAWDTVVLASDVKAQLKELQFLLEDADAARNLGIETPSGLLLAGPPGNGKTTIAKVLAAQAKCSFYPVSGADITSQWFGQSEKNIVRLFERARENAPSIIFIDEIDGLAPKRGGTSDATDRVLAELLEEIDGIFGQRGVFVIGATNRPDQLDPALLRGGRLSRTVVIPPPEEPARLALLQLFSARMPLNGVDLPGLAAVTDGWSGGDLRALCQEAALAALVAAREQNRDATSVSEADFERAIQLRASGQSF